MKDWKDQNGIIFAQPSNLRFMRGVYAQSTAPAIEVFEPRRSHATILDTAIALGSAVIGAGAFAWLVVEKLCT